MMPLHISPRSVERLPLIMSQVCHRTEYEIYQAPRPCLDPLLISPSIPSPIGPSISLPIGLSKFSIVNKDAHEGKL